MLRLAIDRVSTVQDRSFATTYGTRCFDFPIMVLSSGLAQTVAYYRAKAKGETADLAKPQADGTTPSESKRKAYAVYLDHMADVLVASRLMVPKADVLTWVLAADVPTYMLATQRLVQAGVYFKHLATSLLGVDSTTEAAAEDDDDA
jgi:CRISPR type III-B/RAMP module-associated protein Cmr5